MKRLYLFVGLALLIGLIGYPFVRELQHVSQVKKSKSDFQQVLDPGSTRRNPVKRSSSVWDRLPKSQQNKLEEVGFFPASLRDGQMGFTLETVEGRRVSLSDYTGRWVLINFWATWCPPCRMEMPSLDQFQEEFQGTLKVLTINVQQTPDIVRRFRANYNFDLTVLMDSKGEVAQQYGVTGLPESWLLTPAGKPLLKLNGPVDWHKPTLVETFEKVFEESA